MEFHFKTSDRSLGFYCFGDVFEAIRGKVIEILELLLSNVVIVSNVIPLNEHGKSQADKFTHDHINFPY